MTDDSHDWWLSNGVRLGDMMRGFGGLGPGGAPMEPSPFWSAQCPARGPGLRHRHATECKDGHAEDRCCECGGSQFAKFDAGEAGGLPLRVMPPLDVAARLKAVGSLPPKPADNPPPALRPVPRRIMPWESDDEVLAVHLHEQKHVTGHGPTGTVNGPGRGPLTPRQQARLMAWAGWARHLDNAEAVR
jgi:hypothetical protein